MLVYLTPVYIMYKYKLMLALHTATVTKTRL